LSRCSAFFFSHVRQDDVVDRMMAYPQHGNVLQCCVYVLFAGGVYLNEDRRMQDQN
jgi:hypothetical protein